MADADPPVSPRAARRFLTFRSADRLYALPAEMIVEVIRAPALTRVPHAPHALLGLTNLRGAVVPVASLARLLGGTDPQVNDGHRALVLAGDAPVILTVAAVETVIAAEPDHLTKDQVAIAAGPGEALLTLVRASDGRTAKVLDVSALLAAAFVTRPESQAAGGTVRSIPLSSRVDRAEATLMRLLVFDADAQTFAFELTAVHELISAPATLARPPQADARTLGVAPYRETLLPVFSLGGLLGLQGGANTSEQKVVVTKLRGALVGLAVDQLRAVATVERERIEPVPDALAARIGGEAQIKSMVRGEDGRLISILSPERLFKEDVMQRLGGTADLVQKIKEENASETTVVVFRLEDSEYALPIEAVDEVTRVPAQITRLPKTPAFLEGVINLRGEVLPLIDQRRRFDLAPLENRADARIVIVRTAQRRAALIVDSVSEVLRRPSASLLAPPHLAGEAARLVSGVFNVEEAERMVLVLDPAELLSQTERALLDAFEAEEISGAQ